MNGKSYRLLALVFVFALVFGMFAAVMPTPAQAAGLAGPPPGRPYHSPQPPWMHGTNPHYNQSQLPNPFIRDFGDRQVWWQYELKKGHYVRTYSPKKYGDVEVSYDKNIRELWATNPPAIP
ncbi:MAG: hypothetical protein ACK2UO_04365 [Caldilineaceae bacterium]